MNYIQSNGVYTVIAGGTVYTFDKEHPHYDKLEQSVKENDLETLQRWINEEKVIADWAGIEQEEVSSIFPNEMTDRIRSLIAEGHSSERYQKFCDNLKQNPSCRSVQQAFKFLELENLPLTEDGNFLAYKYVRKNENGDLVDCHTGRNINNVGTVVKMDRNMVCDDPQNACAAGLHVGSLRYATSRDLAVIVEVNPKDIVCVPYAEAHKCRVCEYKVVDMYKSPLPSTYTEQEEEEEEFEHEMCEDCGYHWDACECEDDFEEYDDVGW